MFLEIQKTADILARKLVPVLKSEDISATQYNVLRILRGSPQGLPCGEIANRMITRDPDMTRLLDRMERRGLISRARDDEDRRTVITRITVEGRDLLARLDKPIHDAHRRQFGHMSVSQLRDLARLLQAARE